MSFNKKHPNFLIPLVFGCLLIFSFIFSPFTNFAYAEPVDTPDQSIEETPSNNTSDQNDQQNSSQQQDSNQQNSTNNSTEPNQTGNTQTSETNDPPKSCHDQVGAMGWILCPSTGALAKAIDSIYGIIEGLLIVKPLTNDPTSPITAVWEYSRNITNIVFIILLLVVIYSQLTGFGFSNYNIKKVLPRILISAILINLSFHICSIAVDVSNILGASLVKAISSIGEAAIASGNTTVSLNISVGEVFVALTGGAVVGNLAIGLAGGVSSFFWMLVTIIFGAAISVIVGLLTISLRQAVISLLVMISPLAFVAYLLPNTEKWYKKWLDLFTQMLIFYPMFSLLFAASRLAGWVLISSASDALGVILGIAVQIFPLIISASIMKMSKTALGAVSNKLNGLGSGLNSRVAGYSKERQNIARQAYLNKHLKNPSGANFLSGGFWLARSERNKTKLADKQKQEADNTSNLIREQLNARKIGTRIIGYSDDGRPIYSRRPIKVTPEMRREYEHREIKLRASVSDLKMDNSIGALSGYMNKHGLSDKKLENLIGRQGENYLNLTAQQLAKARNDQADKRWANEKFMEASKKGPGSEEYQKLIVEGAGADYYNSEINSKDPEIVKKGERIRRDAIIFTESTAFEQFEKEREITVKKYTSYYDSKKTMDVWEDYHNAVEDSDIDRILAIHKVFAKRGDFDKINTGITQLLQNNKIELGTDISNRLALDLLGYKDGAPTLARLGKHINMETWAFSDGKRSENTVTLTEFLTGEDASGRKTKTNIVDAMQGTSLKNIDRTSMAVIQAQLDEIEDEDQRNVVKRALMKSMMPQIISAFPTFSSGSEQMVKLLGFMTGAEYKNEVDQNGRPVLDKNGVPKKSYNISSQETPSDAQFYFDQTEAYINSLTADNLIDMKSDVFGAIMSRFTKQFGSEDQAKQHLRNLCDTKINQILSGDKSALNRMKIPIMEALGIDPNSNQQKNP